MKRLIVLLAFLYACNGQEATPEITWSSNPVQDSVLYYELYVVNNPDSMTLVNLGWENDTVSTAQEPYYEKQINAAVTITNITVSADGEYLQVYLIAVNRYGESVMAASNIIRKPRELSPSKMINIILRLQ